MMDVSWKTGVNRRIPGKCNHVTNKRILYL